MTLSERGEYDEKNGTGRVPNRKDFPFPNWMKKKKSRKKKVEKYYE